MTTNELAKLNERYTEALLHGTMEEVHELEKQLVDAWTEKYRL